MKHSYRMLLLAATVAAMAAPARASSVNIRGAAGQAADQARLQGTIEQVMPGSGIRVGGKTYIFAMASARVYDRSGARISTPRLAPGQAISFTLSQDGSQQRINELWLKD